MTIDELPPLHCPVLAEIAASLASTCREGCDLLDSLDAERGNRVPAPGSWSALQAIEHLNVTAEAYHPAMVRSIRDAVPGSAPFGRGTWLGRLLVATVHPENRRRVKTPKRARPAQVRLDPAEVRERYVRHHRDWQQLARDADGLDLGRARVRSPLARWLHLSLEQAFTLQRWHERRHLDQALRAAT